VVHPPVEQTAASRQIATGSPRSVRLGERVRQLRIAAGLTQTELAGDRFSKEYVSQIERGKTRPTTETVDWLATRLGVDPGVLAHGVSAEDRGRVEAAIAQAEAMLGAGSFPEAATAFAAARPQTSSVAELEVRALVGESRARIQTGEIREALDLLVRARTLAEDQTFSDVERAEVLLWLGAARYKLSSIQTALGLLNEALSLAERSGLPCDRLRTDILNWRSRCYRRQRDFEAAREDVELALELAQGLGDRRQLAHSYFHASLIAERQGHWLLARTYAERAKAQYEELEDTVLVGRIMNNIGGLHVLLGRPADAVSFLTDAFRIALDAGDDADAAVAVSSLAQVHLATEDYPQAEEHARHALKLADGRVDQLHVIGSAQLTLGRALLEQDRLDEAGETFAAAEASFDQLESSSHRAAAWVAQGDLATRRGDDRHAARLYRAAAEALQDFRF
jgi:transcriptional regulator with XRE-family HTH domain